MTRLRDRMTAASKLRYLAWRAGLLGDQVAIRLTTGETLVLLKSVRFALGVAYEVFVSEIYRSPRPIAADSVRRIIDVGANVGFTISYWAAKFPNAHIDAIEPVPAHLAALRKAVRINHLDRRVTVHPVAVGVAAGVCEMVNAGTSSTMVRERRSPDAIANLERFQVPVVDIFELIQPAHVDLLKVDCEGAEYDILMDPRFAAIDVDNLVLEWHATEEHPEADREIMERLRELDWTIQPISSDTVENQRELGLLRVGMLWGYRRDGGRDAMQSTPH